MGTIKRVLAAGAVAAAFAIIGATTASAATMTEYGITAADSDVTPDTAIGADIVAGAYKKLGASTDATAIEYGLASTGPDASANIVAGAFK